jgi:hypothetical protein
MFNLQTAAGWEALGAAWRVAVSNNEAALEIFSDRERAAYEEIETIGPAGDALDFEAQRKRSALVDAIKARHGVPEAEALQSAASDVEHTLEGAALDARAPTLAAFILKLDMVSDPHGWNSFDEQTWPLFLADVRRFAYLKTISKKEAR